MMAQFLAVQIRMGRLTLAQVAEKWGEDSALYREVIAHMSN